MKLSEIKLLVESEFDDYKSVKELLSWYKNNYPEDYTKLYKFLKTGNGNINGKVFDRFFQHRGLESFKGFPTEISSYGTEFDFSYNKFTSLIGYPKHIESDIVKIFDNEKSIDFGSFTGSSIAHGSGFLFISFSDPLLFLKCKNVSNLFQKMKCHKIEIVGKEVFPFKQVEGDFDEWTAEVSNWCAMNDYPSDFWGE